VDRGSLIGRAVWLVLEEEEVVVSFYRGVGVDGSSMVMVPDDQEPAPDVGGV